MMMLKLKTVIAGKPGSHSGFVVASNFDQGAEFAFQFLWVPQVEFDQPP